MNTLFTIGYEGTDIERFIRTLKAEGICQLADVRAVAISRKPGFSKNRLRERLEAESIRYLHFVSLGNPKSGREAAWAGDFKRFQKIYCAHIKTEEAQHSLQQLAKTAQIASTCLLCFERDPETCHRAIVAHEASVETGLEVRNLFVDNLDRYERNTTTQSRLHSGESLTAT